MNTNGLIRLAASTVLLVVACPVQADMIFLKDGFILQGKVRRENSKEVDTATNEVLTIPKGFFFVDDGARRHYFPPAQVQQVDEMHIAQEDTIRTSRTIIFPKYRPLPPILEILETGVFNEKWDRGIKYRSPSGPILLNQHVSVLNSNFARLDCTTQFPWNSYYLTRELGPEVVAQLLSRHPEFEEPPGLDATTRVNRRLRYARFFVRVGWYEEAEKEFDRIARDFPKELEMIGKEREALRKLQVEQLSEQIAQGEKAGRTAWVLKQIDNVPEKLATPRVLARMATIKNRLTAGDEKLKELKSALETLFTKLESTEDKKFFEEVFAALKLELNSDTLDRFETFLTQARQYERQIKAKGTADVPPVQLLALATSSWLLGNAAGELKLEMAQKLWRGRQFVAEYVKSKENERVTMLARYEKDPKDALSVDEMAQLIALMPPIEAEEKPEVEIVDKTVGETTYTLQLPSEYRHTKSYPVLIVLHDAKEKPGDMMKRFGDEATKNGYLLVAPDWSKGDGGGYRWTTREHACVMDTILDLRRRYQIDSDRIFLFGLGQGGLMAYDVGLAHPDLFAGVLPMSTAPDWFSKHYWANAQYLPFYVVGGDQAGDNNIKTREQFEKWVPHGYPGMFVQYKGRSNEWFGAEVPSMFDWMSRKKRFFPLTNLGRYGTGNLGDMFTTFRATDNRFYWITSDKIHPRHFNGDPNWSPRVLPATVYARIDPASNTINVNPFGFQQLTIWLARTGQIDFEKRVTVRVGITVYISNGKVTPKRNILLDDFARRLDRQNLYVAKIDLKV